MRGKKELKEIKRYSAMLNERKKELNTTMSDVSAHPAPPLGMAMGEVKCREFDHAYPMLLLHEC